MDTSDMRGLMVLWETQSVSRAAESLFMSQQGVSNLLQRLEKELGAELFRRTRSGLEPTEYSLAIRPYVDNLLSDFQAMQNKVELLKKEDSRLFVTMDLGILAILTPKPFLAFKADRPQVEFIMQEHTPKTNERLLSQENADLCLALAPYSTQKFDITPIYNVTGAVLMDEKNPLACRDAIYVDDLRTQPMIAIGSAAYYPYLRACRRGGFEPQIAVSAIDLQDPRPYVRGAEGLCPSFPGIIPPLEQGDGLVVVPFKSDLQWSICSMTKKGRNQSRLCREFITQLTEFTKNVKIL